MSNYPLRFGLIAGGTVICLTLLFYFVDKSWMVSFGSFVEFGIVIYFMSKTVSAVRSESDGFISFGNAFKPAWGTFIITTTITTLFTFLLMNYIDPSLKDVVKEIQAEAFEQASGWLKLGESDKEKMMEQLAESDAFDIKSIAFALPFSFIFPGTLYALIIALIMKKEPLLPNT